MSSSAHFSRWLSKLAIGGTFAGSSFFIFKKDNKDEVKVNSEYSKWDSNWDKRDVHSLIQPKKNRSEERLKKKIKKLTPYVSRNIIMIRHGQYQIKEADEDQRKLTTQGCEQASILGQRLKDMNLNYTKIIRSNMIRAIETTDIIQKFVPGIPLENTDMLNEGRPIPVEPKYGSYWFEYEYFQDGPRIEAAFRKYFHRASAQQTADSFELMVCHANVIRYFVCRLLQVSPEAWLRFGMHHCSITWVTIEPNGNVILRCYGEAGFMPRNKLSS